MQLSSSHYTSVYHSTRVAIRKFGVQDEWNGTRDICVCFCFHSGSHRCGQVENGGHFFVFVV